ncbi:hypothetical protein [Aestuariivirga sp.]|uniref:hypothetical protein n=1 Tax=Aestuariivirga sp. TaxID=2650926 RepID=UPI003919A872
MKSPLSPIGSRQETPLAAALLKLIDIVEEENGILQRHGIVLHAGFTDRKNHALRELMAARRCESSPAAVASSRPLLRHLSESLRRNAALLKLHITALGDISDIIIGSMRDAESDGTYSRSRSRPKL